MNRRRLIVHVLLVVASLQAGCSVAPANSRTLYQTPERMATLGRIGLATGRFTVNLDTQFNSRERLEFMPSDDCPMLAGPGWEVFGFVGSIALPILDPMVLLIHPEFALPALAVPVGAAQALTRNTPGPEQIAAAEATVRDILSRHESGTGLRQALARYALEHRLGVEILPPDAGPGAVDAPPDYNDDVRDLVDTVLEVSVVSLTARSFGAQGQVMAFLEMAVSVRLVSTRDNQVLDAYAFTHISPPRALAEWADGGAQMLDESIARAYREISEHVVDKSLLVRSSPQDLLACNEEAARRGDESLLDYGNRLLFSPHNMDAYPPVAAEPKGEVLQPTLSWKPAAMHAAGTPVTYEVRVFDAVRLSKGPLESLYFPDAEIYRRAGLTDPEHRIETKLLPCRSYFWSVRALYEVDGRPWATQWAGDVWTSPVGSRPFLRLDTPRDDPSCEAG